MSGKKWEGVGRKGRKEKRMGKNEMKAKKDRIELLLSGCRME